MKRYGHVGDSFFMSIMVKEALLERVTSMFERRADTFRNHLSTCFVILMSDPEHNRGIAIAISS